MYYVKQIYTLSYLTWEMRIYISSNHDCHECHDHDEIMIYDKITLLISRSDMRYANDKIIFIV